ncbi:LysM peptidoglycan-binding domain-containing protein [bacterium]|nr:LysM peptidoglycan-binding domain-containing protein [bacterium]MCB2179235.1 LysM peptidoglycan-binding domain-containing protein [bacterium]
MNGEGEVPGKTKRKFWRWGILIGIVLIVGIIGIRFYRGLPEVDRGVVASSPFAVTLRAEGGASRAPWQAPVSLRAEVYAAVPVVQLEFWVNGERVEMYSPPAGGNSGTVLWDMTWLSAAPGSYLLTVRVVAADGAVAISNVVSFYRVVSPDPYLDYTAEEGDTLETIAAEYGVDAEQLIEKNPDMGGGAVSPGDQIAIPINLPAPGDAPVDVPKVEPGGKSSPTPSKLSAWWQNLLGSIDTIPAPPEIALAAIQQQGQCGVQVQITDLADNESGYFIYQASAGSPVFEQVGAVAAANGDALVFEHLDQSGSLVYYAAAFNFAGEAASTPASIDLNALGCTSQASAGVQFSQNRLFIDQPVDWVYLYLSIDQGDWQRVPAEEGKFIQSDGGGYDLSPYLDALFDEPGSHHLEMEVWGWVNGNLTYLGNLTTTLSQTKLIGCPYPTGQCLQGLGWSNTIWIEPDEEDRAREFRWSSNAAGATGGIYQVATQPFPDDYDLNPPGLLLSGDAGAVVDGNTVTGSAFFLDFGELAAAMTGGTSVPALSAQPAGEYDWLLPLLQPTGPSFQWMTEDNAEPMFYVRVVPMAGNQPAAGASNPVTVVYQPAGEQENILVEVPVPPELYDIEIVDFTPIIPQSMQYGCVYITDIDYAVFMTNITDFVMGTIQGEDLYEMYKSAYENHTPICPEPYKGVGEPAWYESFLDFLSSASAWLSELYSDIKAGVIDIVATALDALPIIDCDDSCRYLLEKGLDAGMLALGIPPELPNLEQLTDQGLDYLVEIAAEEMGVTCDEECKQIIRDGIKEMASQVTQQKLDLLCGDEAWAHDHAIEPMCFPEGITVEVAPESMTQPPVTTVRITRRMEPAEVDVDLSQYSFLLTFPTVTDLGEGIRVQVNTGFYEGGYSVQSFSEYLPLDGPVSGMVFRSAEGSIPAMQPGESMELTLVQEPAKYWLPGHEDLIAQEGGFVRYDDFWLLYYQGNLTIHAEIVCPDNTQYYPTTQSCGGGDVYETILPNQ